jgi:AcrR family transcriptional regulator
MTELEGDSRRTGRGGGSATEDLLVESTLRCLGRTGVAGATARTITTDAGVNLAAITYHFGSKDHLVDRALVRAVRRLLDPVVVRLEEAPGDPGAVAAALALVDERAAEGGAPCALYAEAAARAVRSDLVQRGWEEVHQALRDGLADHPRAALLVTAVVGTLTAASAGAGPEPGALVALATG